MQTVEASRHYVVLCHAMTGMAPSTALTATRPWRVLLVSDTANDYNTVMTIHDICVTPR